MAPAQPDPCEPARERRDATLDLHAQLQRLSLMCDSVPVQMAYYRRGGGLVCDYANQGYAATFGLPHDAIVGLRLVEIIGDAALQQIQPHIDRVFATRQTVGYTRNVAPPGRPPRWIEVSLVPHGVAADGRALSGDAVGRQPEAEMPLAGAFVLLTDITRFRDAEQALRDSEERLRKFMDASVEGIAFHREGMVTDVNAPMAALLGYQRHEMLGRHVLDFVAPEHRARAEQGRTRPSDQPYESALLDRQGQPLPVELFVRELHRDQEPLRMVVARDIRDRLAARQRMQHLAEHDALTGLRNRGAFMAALAEAVAQHRADEPPLALMFVDLDHFKQINDVHGHLAGDALLREVSARLLGALRNGAVAGRFGGDEFVVLMPAVADAAEAHDAAVRLLGTMAEPVPWNDHALSVTPTIGLALYPQDAPNADTLLRHADAALYAGKASGRAMVRPFEPAMAMAAESAQRQQARLAEGLARGEFQLVLQPRLALPAAPAAGRLAGLQASLRWHHPERGWLPAAEIAPPGALRLQQPLVEWALQQALQLSARWQAAGRSLALSLNLGGLVPTVATLASTAGRVLARLPGPPGPLALELPERLLADDPAGLRRALVQLDQLGLPVWLDDFGAGGATLVDLRGLPLAGLVLSPTLVTGLPGDRASLALLQGIFTLATGLGWATGAPGVSSGEQASLLRGLGCGWLQGPWYERPMPLAEAQAWLAAQGGMPGAR